MMILAEHIPKTPEILFMPRPKNPNAKAGEAKARYYRKMQPDPADRMTHQEFLQWGEAMGYSKGGVLIHPDKMAQDLGIQTTRVYAYWRGTDKGKELRPTLTITRLCDALRNLKPHGKARK